MKIGLVILVALLCFAGTAAAMGSTDYDLSWNVMGGGGGTGESSSYGMSGTVGQITGFAASDHYLLSAGYWIADGSITPPTTGWLKVTSVPSGATILIEEEDSGFTTDHTFELSPGKVNVSVEKECYVTPEQREVTVVAGQTTNAEFVLVWDGNCGSPPETGDLHVTSVPDGAEIFLNDMDSGFTTEHTFTLETGTVRVVVEKDCYFTPQPVDVSIIAGETTEAPFTLEWDPACSEPVPEFPSLLVPAVSLVAMIGTIVILRRMKG